MVQPCLYLLTIQMLSISIRVAYYKKKMKGTKLTSVLKNPRKHHGESRILTIQKVVNLT